MRKLLASALIVMGALFLFGQTVAAGQGNTDKVTICHRTNADNHPYVKLTVDRNAVDGRKNPGADHYGQHKGPVWNPSLKAQKIKWGDIIPPVPGFHEGLNWTTEGRVIYDNECSPIAPTTTTTVPDTTSTTVGETTTTTEAPTLIPPQDLSRPAEPVRVTELPYTGSNDGWLLLLGLGLIVAGICLIAKGNSLRR